MSCHFFLQGIFLTQESNPHLLHYRQILYHWATWEALSLEDILQALSKWLLTAQVTSDKWFPRKGSSPLLFLWNRTQGPASGQELLELPRAHFSPGGCPLPMGPVTQVRSLLWGGAPASPWILCTLHALFYPWLWGWSGGWRGILVAWHWQRVEEGMCRANQSRKPLGQWLPWPWRSWVKIPQGTVHLGTQCRQPPVLAEPAGVCCRPPGWLVLSVAP